MKKRAVLFQGFWASNMKHGPIRSGDNVAEVTAKAKKDLEKLQTHYDTDQGTVVSEGQPFFLGEADPIFD